MTDQSNARFVGVGLDPESIREEIEDHLDEAEAAVEEHVEGVYDEGVTAVFSINNQAIPFPEARLRARQDLALTMDSLMRLTG